MKKEFTISPGADNELRVAVEALEVNNVATRYAITFNPGTDAERVREVASFSPKAGGLHLLAGGESFDIDYHSQQDVLSLLVAGEVFEREVLNDRKLRMRAVRGGGSGADHPELDSPMAGKVIKILVEEGQNVEEGDPVVIVEAMKMENDLKAHRSGVVGSISIAVGDSVDVGDELLRIDEAGDE